MENRDVVPTIPPVLEDDPLAPYGISEPFDRLGSNGNTPRVKAIAMEIDLHPGEAMAQVIYLVRSSAVLHYHPCVSPTKVDGHLYPIVQSQVLDRTDDMESWEDASLGACPGVCTNQHAELDTFFPIGIGNVLQITHWGFAVNACERQEV